jgi:signal transduction histidine kinase
MTGMSPLIPRLPGMHRLWRPVRAGEVVFALAGLPLAIVGVVYVFAVLYAGTILALTLIGLPLAASGVRGARKIGGVHRFLVGKLLGERIDAPAPLPPSRTLAEWTRAGLTDPVGWRALSYLAIRLPVGVMTFLAAIVLPLGALWGIGFPLWVRLLQQPWVGRPAWWDAASVLSGLLVLLAVPAAIQATSWLNRWLARRLLRPSPGQERLDSLQRANRILTVDSAASLRMIERDLHDSTQAELVAIAITLSLAADALHESPEPAVGRLADLIVRARAQTDNAITNLRRITRGINPPVLDAGLEAALPSLAAGSKVRTSLNMRLKERPSAVIERVVYFCVAELLTNVAKHSGASSCAIEAHAGYGHLRVTVSDDGKGGARVGNHGGLAGLEARVAAVAGTFNIRSPVGGPTTVMIDLPSTG